MERTLTVTDRILAEPLAAEGPAPSRAVADMARTRYFVSGDDSATSSPAAGYVGTLLTSTSRGRRWLLCAGFNSGLLPINTS
jgi:hypothetical protein